jgi:phage terminase small subunit
MARPRKLTSILELNGAFKHDPKRKRPNEPKELRALGDPPARLSKKALPFWHELVSIAPAGVLTIADRWAVELAARLMMKATGGRRIPAAELATLRSLLAALGMTPADRSKLSVKTEKPKANPYTDLAQEAISLRTN